MELTVLGCSGSYGGAGGVACSGYLLRSGESSVWVDCGNGTFGHLQEHLNLLYYLTRGKPLNQTRAVAEATAAAILGRTAAYTGQNVFWRSMMDDPNKNPELYNMKVSPSAEDFEKGTVKIPEEGVIPIPGKKA